MRIVRKLATPLLFASLLAACRAEKTPRPTASDPPPAAAPAQGAKAAAATAGAVLTTTGQPAFQGASAFFCVPHAEGGLQVDFRTGSDVLPAVAVRIDSFRGSGPYQGRLFVTGRSLTGALVTSPGEAEVDVRQQTPAGGAAVAVLSGSFRGRYDGEAGKGTIEGRFDSCNYSSSPAALAGTDAADERHAGALEETHDGSSDASSVPARSRVGARGARDRVSASGRRGGRARRADGGGGSRRSRGHRAGLRRARRAAPRSNR